MHCWLLRQQRLSGQGSDNLWGGVRVICPPGLVRTHQGGYKRSGNAGLLATRILATCSLATLRMSPALLQEKRGAQGRGRTQRLVDNKLRMLRMDANTQALLHERICKYTSQNHSEHTTLEELAAESGVSAGWGMHLACQSRAAVNAPAGTTLAWVAITLVTVTLLPHQVRISCAASSHHAQTHHK